MLMSKEQRAVMKYGNKYALSDGKVQAPIKHNMMNAVLGLNHTVHLKKLVCITDRKFQM